MTADEIKEHASFAEVLAQYGQSMMRVGQLEQELEMERSGVHASGESPKVNDTQAKREIADAKAKLQDREQEIVALRLQLETMQGELNETKTKLKLAAEGNYIRHRKNKEAKPAWKKLLTGGR